MDDKCDDDDRFDRLIFGRVAFSWREIDRPTSTDHTFIPFYLPILIPLNIIKEEGTSYDIIYLNAHSREGLIVKLYGFIYDYATATVSAPFFHSFVGIFSCCYLPHIPYSNPLSPFVVLYICVVLCAIALWRGALHIL